LAADEEARIAEASKFYWDMVFRGAREQEVNKLDLSTRSLPWKKGENPITMICEVGPYRGTLRLGQNAWFWESQIEQPNQGRHFSPRFVRLEQALDWTEKELLALQKAESEKPALPPPPPPKPKMDLTPYRLDPSAIEPSQITFRVLIELEGEPDYFRTIEFEPGNIYRYDEEYPSPRRLNQELNIDSAKATIEWPGGFKGKTYFIYSKATYFEKTVVTVQA
jgi:hypothetical protein